MCIELIRAFLLANKNIIKIILNSQRETNSEPMELMKKIILLNVIFLKESNSF